MREEIRNCPRCQGEMVEGILLDHSMSGVESLAWAEGPVDSLGKYRRNMNVRSYRCTSCNLIETYASE